MDLSGLALLAAVLPLSLGAPQQPPFANTTKLPTHFGALIFPHFQALDLYGPLDLFNTISMLYANQTTMHLSILAKTMDPVSTAMTSTGFGESTMPTITFKDYLARNSTKGDDDDTSENSEDAGDCDDGAGGHVVAKRDVRFGALQKSPRNMPSGATSNPGDIEVLIIPGGGGTRKDLTEEIAFVREIYPKLQYIITVCTGSTLLSRAGILDGKSATSNKRAWPWVLTTGPNVKWVPTARWVQDGNIWTTSGISAGLDGAYAWVSHVYGEATSLYMSQALEYDRITDEHYDPYGKIWDVPGAV